MTKSTRKPGTEQPGDVEKCGAIIAVLEHAPSEGMTAAEVLEAVNAAGVQPSRAHTYRLLRALNDAGELHQTGVKGQYRYHRGAAPDAAAAA